MTLPFTVESYSDRFWRVTCAYCHDIWQEEKQAVLPASMRCRSCKYSGGTTLIEARP